jgi:RsiW-degrading membrane proteinase PrsW (M82 family)
MTDPDDERRTETTGGSGHETDTGGNPHRAFPGQLGPTGGVRRGADAGTEPDDAPAEDPVKAGFRERDLYGIATWERRGKLDSLSVWVTGALKTIRARLLVSVALTLFLAQLVVAGGLVLQEPIIGVLAVLSSVPALFVAASLWYWDPTTREPFELVAGTFLLSMLFASFAAVVNTVLQPGFAVLGPLGLILFYFVVVGPIEEFVKWLAIRVNAYNDDSFRTVLDGVVYGAVAGLGFAAIENFIYVTSSALDGGGLEGLQVQYAALTAATRAFVGPGHVIFSAWAGFYLGLAKFNPDNWAPIVVKGLLIAAFIHACYNTLVGIVPVAAFGLFGIPPVLGFLGFIVSFHGFWFGLLYRKIRAYQQLYRALGETPSA